MITQDRRDEAETVGEHGPLHNVELGENDEEEEGEASNVHRLKHENHQEV